MVKQLDTYMGVSRINIKRVNYGKMRKLRKPIYKEEQISYKYNINSRKYNNEIEQNKTYVAILQIGIVKELRQQAIITDEEMIDIIKQIRKKNRIEEQI